MDVAVFVVDGVADFGLTAVLEVLRTANGLASDLPDPPRPFGIRTVSAGGAVRSAHGYTIPAEPVKTVLAEGPDLLLVPAREQIRSRSLPPMNETPVKTADLGPESGMIGAAEMALEETA